MRRRSFVLSLAAIVSLIVSVFSFSPASPPAAHAAGITIDGVHEAAWGSPAVRPVASPSRTLISPRSM